MTQSFSEITFNSTLSKSPSLKVCAFNNSNHKKRLFVRKPGPNYLILPVEKHRKNLSEHINMNQPSKQSYFQDSSDQKKWKENPKTFRMERHTQNFKKQYFHETSFVSNNWSPKKSTVDLLLGLKYIQRTTEQNNGQSVSFRPKKPVICFSDLEIHQNVNLDDTSDNSLKNESRNPETDKTLPQSEDKFQCGPSHQLKNLLKGASYHDSGVKYDTFVCAQCKNLKRMNQLLNDKCAKLQKQLQLRSEDVRILSQKIQCLREQKQTSKSKMYSKEIQIYEDCSSRYENVRKQLSRVVQRVKYLEIENGVLSRYKQDCILAQRDYEKIKQQNDNLKRQIHTISRMGQKYNKKPNGEIGRKQHGGGKNPYFKLTKQEDTISLELSEASYEYS